MSPLEESIQILHVDDEPEFADLAADYVQMTDNNLEVETTDRVDKALDRLDETDFDCIVSDYDMPRRDGLEFLEIVRDESPELPFILFTGKGSEEVASEAIDTGVTSYLQKRSGIEQYELLANRIRNAVESHRVSRAINQTEQWASTMLEYSSDFVFVVNQSGEVSYVSPAVERVLGYDPEAVREKSAFEFTHPDDIEKAQETFAETLNRPNEDLTVEFRAKHADGSYRRLEVRGRNLLDDPVISGILVNARDVTERQEREVELNRERKRFAALYDNFPEPTLHYEFEGGEPIILAVNNAFEEVFGYDSDRTNGSSVNDLIVPPGKQEDAEAIDERVKAGELIDAEIRRRTTTGPRDFRFRNIPVQNSDPSEGFGVYIDITERKERERELRRLKEEYETVFEAAQEAIFIFDVKRSDSDYEFTLRRLNPTHEAISGHKTEEARGKTPVELLGEEDGSEVRSRYRRCVETGEPLSYEETLEMPAGRIQWRTNLVPVVEEDQVIQLVGVARDITDDEDRAEKITALHGVAMELEASETGTDVYQRLVDAAEEVLKYDQAIADTVRGNVLLPVATSSNLDPEEYYDRTSISASDNLAAEAFRTGQSSVVVDLRNREVSPAKSDYRAALTVPIGKYGVFQAVSTQEGFFDESDRELAELLCNHARAALANIEHRKELQRQNERLEEFTSVVGHDLRNPLTVATGETALAMEECESEHLQKASHSLDRMETLIEDMMSLARAGKTIGDLETVELQSLVKTSWQHVDSETASIVTETHASIEADRTRLQQLLENLLRNAVEHGGPGVTIEIGDLVNGFYVEDDGPGIPPDNSDSVFEPGYSTNESGTGFGLSIVREIVDAHGWDVTVTTSSSGGARFEFKNVS